MAVRTGNIGLNIFLEIKRDCDGSSIPNGKKLENRSKLWASVAILLLSLIHSSVLEVGVADFICDCNIYIGRRITDNSTPA
jgi:hypothetical protein